MDRLMPSEPHGLRANDFEQTLRRDARLAMVAPPPALRRRTFDSLASLAGRPKAPRTASSVGWRPAMAAAVLMCVLVGVASKLGVQRAEVPSASDRVSLRAPFDFAVASDFSVGQPLLAEWRRLAFDTKHVASQIRAGLPSPPRFGTQQDITSPG